MNIVAAVFADFVTGPAGNASALLATVGGRGILARTLLRVARIEGVSARCLFVRARDGDAAAAVVRDAGVEDRIEVLPLDSSPRPRRALLTAARKWNLESWRGGLVGSSWFDEFIDPQAAALVLDHYRCDAVLCIEGHSPVLDVRIATAMVAHTQATEHEAKMVFTQAPPGLAGAVMRREALQDLLEFNIPVGLLLAYRPELAQGDPITQPACYGVPRQVVQTAARFTGDTRRSRELLDMALAELGEDADAAALCEWTQGVGHDRAGALPVEVELELTTADPLPETTLRPRGARVPRREIADLAAVQRLAAELARYDDRLVFLGGHGDPLLHPQFAEVCRILRSAGVYGIGVGTALAELTEEHVAALFDNTVDVVEVRIDAHSPETYRRVHGADLYAQVVANVERLEALRRERKAPEPLVVCSLTRCAATMDELERFYDHWIQKVGSAVITGYNDYGGLLPADTLLRATPDLREPCRRLATRMMLLADGTVALCGQDCGGEVRMGNWVTEGVGAAWGGARLVAVREAHRGLNLESLPICERCAEWSRT
ncbi:MAG: radical SAM protein [Phycisphaerae bacterium]|nr:radical SAM protein [Phycisphaerae bacterium]